jgi:hypothetical protein
MDTLEIGKSIAIAVHVYKWDEFGIKGSISLALL